MESKRNLPVSTLLDFVKEGDDEALEAIWHIYYPRLVALAERNLKGAVPISDADDIAQSTLKSFYFRAKDGRFPDVEDRDSLWKLLIAIALNKARATNRKEGRRRELLEHSLDAAPLERADYCGFDAIMVELRFLLDLLNDPMLEKIALLRFEGYTNKEIAQQIGKSEPTVERKVRLIRDVWSTQYLLE